LNNILGLKKNDRIFYCLLTFVNEIESVNLEICFKDKIMIVRKLFAFGILLGMSLLMSAQSDSDKYGFEKKHQIGTQAFMILTPLLDPSPEYYQLSYGYRLSSKDELTLEAITWRYSGSIGRPYGEDFENPDSDFPGDVKSLGLGLAYKRFLWKGLYGQVHSTAMKQSYRNPDKEEIQSGFMLFNTARVGYHFKLFNNRVFIAPSIATTFWPVLTNMPDAFQVEEDKWSNFLY